jgi:hypothetical protein
VIDEITSQATYARQNVILDLAMVVVSVLSWLGQLPEQ